MEEDVTVEGVRVAAAKYGNGVYATKSYEADEVIGQVEGQMIYDRDYGSDYCIDLTSYSSLEPAAPFCYVNHSCSPNCQFVQYDIEEEDQIVGVEIWLETIRAISAGEQLTIDYAWPASGAIPCGCDSHNCRGWIVAEDQLDELLHAAEIEVLDEHDASVSAA